MSCSALRGLHGILPPCHRTAEGVCALAALMLASRQVPPRHPQSVPSFFALLVSVALLCNLQVVEAIHHMKRSPLQYVGQRSEMVPLMITNQCPDVIYPAIATQAGTPPSTQGFELSPGGSQNLTVGADWQGRVWGRTNCSFNVQGTGPSNNGGLNGGGQACQTGDCNGIVDCVVTVRCKSKCRITQ